MPTDSPVLNPPPPVVPVVAALATVLARASIGESRRSDADLAGRLVEQLMGLDQSVLTAVAGGGVWAAFPDDYDGFDESTWERAAAAARALDHREAITDVVALGAAALGLIAVAGKSEQAADDLVTAAEMARRVEQNRMALRFATAALESSAELPPRRRVLALLVAAVTGNEPVTPTRLLTEASALPDDDELHRIVERLRPSLQDDVTTDFKKIANEAISRRDRRSAARALADEIAEQRTVNPDDGFLAAQHDAYEVLAAPDLDLAGLRSAMKRIVAFVRDRQRFEQLPVSARAGIDMLLLLFTIDLGQDEAAALIEFMDSLTDAGLDDLTTGDGDGRARGDRAEAEVQQAGIVHAAAQRGAWRDVEDVISALGQRTVVVLRERRTRGETGFTALHLRPPATVSFLNRSYSPAVAAALTSLASRARGAHPGSDVPEADLDILVEHLLPQRLLDDLRTGGLRDLMVVPDGDLWFVPWSASTPLSGVDVRLLPSLPRTRVPAATSAPVRDVVAVVDADVAGADLVLASLRTAEESGRLRVIRAMAPPAADEPADLLLFFGHGVGRGLSYSLTMPGGQHTTLDLARHGGFRQALLGACWSAASPATGLLVSAPAALLAAGISPVVGGTWPLPARETAAVLAGAIGYLSTGMDVVSAVRRAVGDAPDNSACRQGLAVFGL